MRVSLTTKMVAALFGMSSVMVALVVVWAGWAINERFSAYVGAAALAGMDRTVAALERSYAEHDGWSDVRNHPARWVSAVQQSEPRPPGPPPDMPPGHPPDGGPGDWPGGGPPGRPPFDFQAGPPLFGPPPGPDGPRLLERLALIDSSGVLVAGVSAGRHHPARRPLFVNGTQVGALLLDAAPLPHGIEAAFLAERAHDLYIAGAVALALSGLWAVLLARNILAPVHLVTAGARRLASGVLSTRIETGRGDELGDLMRDFNKLAVSLETAEQARRLWVADTSHELRTPLAVLRAQIEALQDGVHQVDVRSLGRLHDEVLRMARLVDDLHELARADSHALGLRLEPVRPGEIMQEVLLRFAARREASGLLLHTASLGDGGVVMADPDRLRQVFGNLLENAIRYTDPGGTISVSESRRQDAVLITMEDSVPGVPDGKLPRLFERFFRVDVSRNRQTGGSGLGLAICRAIVEAHDGTISAAASALGGLAVTVSLPAAQDGAR